MAARAKTFELLTDSSMSSAAPDSPPPYHDAARVGGARATATMHGLHLPLNPLTLTLSLTLLLTHVRARGAGAIRAHARVSDSDDLSGSELSQEDLRYAHSLCRGLCCCLRLAYRPVP